MSCLFLFSSNSIQVWAEKGWKKEEKKKTNILTQVRRNKWEKKAVETRENEGKHVTCVENRTQSAELEWCYRSPCFAQCCINLVLCIKHCTKQGFPRLWFLFLSKLFSFGVERVKSLNYRNNSCYWFEFSKSRTNILDSLFLECAINHQKESVINTGNDQPKKKENHDVQEYIRNFDVWC